MVDSSLEISIDEVGMYEKPELENKKKIELKCIYFPKFNKFDNYGRINFCIKKENNSGEAIAFIKYFGDLFKYKLNYSMFLFAVKKHRIDGYLELHRNMNIECVIEVFKYEMANGKKGHFVERMVINKSEKFSGSTNKYKNKF